MNRKLQINFAWLIFLFFLLFAFFGEKMWGVNHLAYLPLWQSSLIVGVSLGLLALGTWAKGVPDFGAFALQVPKWAWIVGAGALMGILFWLLPIPDDFYGDAFRYRPRLGEVVKEVPPGTSASFFNFSFFPAEGRKSGAALVTYLAWGFQLNYGEAFRLMDALFGAGFVMVWLGMVFRHLKTNVWRLMLSLIGLTAPFTLIFYGHIETYAPGYFLQICLLAVYFRARESKQKIWTLALLPLWLLNVKFHPLSALYLPLLVHALADQFLLAQSEFRRWLKPGNFFLLVLIPVFLAGLVLYFFVFEDHIDPRTTENARDLERLFLPLFSPDPPLDRYNLLSLNHFLDFFNVFLIWSPASLLLLAGLNGLRKEDPGFFRKIAPLLLTLVLMVSLLFMVNPLVSMPVDWDLFSLPGPLVVVLGLAAASQYEMRSSGRRMLSLVAALCLLGFSSILVNVQLESYAKRFEDIGVHVFKTYYIRSSDYMLFSLQIRGLEPEQYLKELDRVSTRIESFVNASYDPNYAAICWEKGLAWMRVERNVSMARQLLERAYQFDPSNLRLIRDLLEVKLEAGHLEDANELSRRLLRAGFPNPVRARELALHLAIEQEQWDAVQLNASAYLGLENQSRLFNLVARQALGELRPGEEPVPQEDLKYLLRR